MIRLVTGGSSDDGVIFSHASPVYALKLKPYIEEPPLIATHSNSGPLDLWPDREVVHEIIKHEFILSNRDAIDEYWHVLEYSYAVIDPKAALLAFPRSTVHEVCMHFIFALIHKWYFKNFDMRKFPCRPHLLGNKSLLYLIQYAFHFYP